MKTSKHMSSNFISIGTFQVEREGKAYCPALKNYKRLYNTPDPNKTLDLNSGEKQNMVQQLNAAIIQI